MVLVENVGRCKTCGTSHHRPRPSVQQTVAYSLAALCLMLPANLYPFMIFEIYGNREEATIWGGCVSLARSGSWGIAILVFVASLVTPLLKILGLLYLSLTARNGKRPLFKTKVYHIIEIVGRWSMLDIFLLAVLVAIFKLGSTQVEPGLGAPLFAAVVVFTMLASSAFDPRLLWEKEVHGKKRK